MSRRLSIAAWAGLLATAVVLAAGCSGDDGPSTAGNVLSEREGCLNRLAALEADTKARAMTVAVMLADTMRDADAEQLREELGAQDGVEQVTFVSKEEELERTRKLFEDSPELLDNLQGNPFAGRIEVRVQSHEAGTRLVKEYTGRSGVDTVVAPRNTDLSLEMIENFRSSMPDAGCTAEVDRFITAFGRHH